MPLGYCRSGPVVDRRLSCSAEHVHAVGDCAEVEGLTLPYVMPIMQQARALAATLAGPRFHPHAVDLADGVATTAAARACAHADALVHAAGLMRTGALGAPASSEARWTTRVPPDGGVCSCCAFPRGGRAARTDKVF